jgi:hypothetical protein
MWFAPIISWAEANCSRFFFFGRRTRITGVPSGLNSVGPPDPVLFPFGLIPATPLVYIHDAGHDEDMDSWKIINVFLIFLGGCLFSIT